MLLVSTATKGKGMNPILRRRRQQNQRKSEAGKARREEHPFEEDKQTKQRSRERFAKSRIHSRSFHSFRIVDTAERVQTRGWKDS